MILRRDEAFKAVCELRTPKENNKYSIGTGMFVSSPAGDNQVFGWIVTASHVAIETNNNTRLVVSTKDGTAAELELTKCGPLSNWRHHPTADISVFQIIFSEINKPFLLGHLFPLDHFHLDETAVSRDYELTAIGFPNGLGTEGLFSPFTFRSYASSGFVTLPRGDTKKNSTFFCLENPSVGGYSGCPVFDLGYATNGVITTTKEKTICYGIMHGTLSNEIAMVTPAYFLNDLIDKSF